MADKVITCRDHGGTFSITPRRGRPPVKCNEDNPCSALTTPRKTRSTRGTAQTPAKTPTKAAETAAERPKRANRGADTRPGRRERVSGLDRITASVNAATGRGPATAKGVRESRSAKSGWCRCPEMNKEPHERGSEGCKYNQPDPTTTEKELPDYAVFYPSSGDTFAIIHAPECDHLTGAKLKRTTPAVPLDLFADDYTENVSKIDVDELGYDMDSIVVTNCAKNYAKRHRTATQKAAEKAAPLTKTVNPCIPFAHKAKTDLEPLGWSVTGRQWSDGDVFHAQITATRGTELLLITWTAERKISGGEFLVTSDQQYSLWSTEKPSENPKPKAAKLPFNPALIEDADLIRTIAGQRVMWANRLRKGTEEAVVSGTRIQIDHTYNGEGHSIPGERIIKFVDHDGGGYRAFRLSALVKIG